MIDMLRLKRSESVFKYFRIGPCGKPIRKSYVERVLVRIYHTGREAGEEQLYMYSDKL